MNILDQLENEDPEKIPVVTITDTDGNTGRFEFLDIVTCDKQDYAVLCPEGDKDGFVDIFRILREKGEEKYEAVTDDSLLEEIFEIFEIKNEDEFDFI